MMLKSSLIELIQLFNVVIWLFALAMAYPYLPGSHSDAFKGVSVLAGLMLGALGLLLSSISPGNRSRGGASVGRSCQRPSR